MPRPYSNHLSAAMANDKVALTAFHRVRKYQNGQIVGLAFTFLLSTAACLSLSYVNYVLSPDCLLFAKWIGSATNTEIIPEPTSVPFDGGQPKNNSPPNAALNSDPGGNHWFLGDCTGKRDQKIELLQQQASNGKEATSTKWGNKRQCHFTQYSFAAAAVASFILCWFFVFFRPSKEAYFFRKKTAASKFVIPGILFCLAFALCIFIATITLQVGLAYWCHSVDSIDNMRCSLLPNWSIEYASKTTCVNIYGFMVAGQVFAWFASVVWFVDLGLLVLRCYRHIDFPDYFFDRENLHGLDNPDTETD